MCPKIPTIKDRLLSMTGPQPTVGGKRKRLFSHDRGKNSMSSRHGFT